MARDADGYTVLHYAGDVTEGHPYARTGQLLGADELDRPYEITECELIASPPYEGCLDCSLPLPHTHAYLQYAKPETLRRAREVLEEFARALVQA